MLHQFWCKVRRLCWTRPAAAVPSGSLSIKCKSPLNVYVEALATDQKRRINIYCFLFEML